MPNKKDQETEEEFEKFDRGKWIKSCLYPRKN
jgi:hypothetical protein